MSRTRMDAADGGEALYLRFAEFFNARRYDRLGEVMAPDFVDHHPGLVDVAGLPVYRRNLALVIEALEVTAHPQHVVAAGDQVFTRIRLVGRHTGTFLGVPPSGNDVEWHTHELWRCQDGKFVERWAVDDLHTLLGQMDVELPGWQTA